MAWVDLSAVFTFGSQLTSLQQRNLRDNITALANGDSGAPPIQTAAVNSGAITRPKLELYDGANTHTILNNTRVETTASGSFVVLKTILMTRSGDIDTSFDLKVDNDTWYAHGRIYVNSSAVGIDNQEGFANWTTFTEDITVNAGDLLQLYAYQTGSTFASVRNFKIRNGNPLVEISTVSS